jgi:hypothetical protein
VEGRGEQGAAEQQSLWGVHDPFDDTAPQPVVTAAAAPVSPVAPRGPSSLTDPPPAPRDETPAPTGGRHNPLVWVATVVAALLVLGAGGVWALARSAPAAPSVPVGTSSASLSAADAVATPTTTTGGRAPLAASQPTLVLGDSLALVVYPYLADLLPDRYVSYVAEVGRSTAKIATALEAERSIPPVVIVSAGTNDQLASDIGPGAARILATLGSARCVVWADVVRPDSYGDPATEVNAALDAALAGHPNVTVLRWSQMVLDHPEYLAHDGIHPTEAGVKARAQAYADAAKACSPLDPTAPRAKRQVLPASVFWGPISGAGSGSGSSSSGNGSGATSRATSTRSASPSPSRTTATPRATATPSATPSASPSKASPVPQPEPGTSTSASGG